jgi:hypothetical protein
MKGICEYCDQPGELERFPTPGGDEELMMCEPCRNGDAVQRLLEFVMVPAGEVIKTGELRNGKPVYALAPSKRD